MAIEDIVGSEQSNSEFDNYDSLGPFKAGFNAFKLYASIFILAAVYFGAKYFVESDKPVRETYNHSQGK